MNATVDDLMPIARMLARKPSLRQPLEPGYGINPGDKVLIVVNTRFDQRVLQAIERAIVEVGGVVDVIRTHADSPQTYTSNVGHLEIPTLAELQARRAGSGGGGGGTDRVRAFFTAGGGYNVVINGSGGPPPVEEFRWEYIPWDTVDKFMYSMAAVPYEIQNRVDELLWNAMTKARTIHNTDPEGTDLTTHWLPHFGTLLRESKEHEYHEIMLKGHMSAMPLFLSPIEADANGVIGGTTNHTGSYPNIKVTVQKNSVVKIEGGGEYGKRWQALLDECLKDKIHNPVYPSAGCGWLIEIAIGTDQWRARDMEADLRRSGYVWERGRSGVIHWGMGGRAEGVGHWHIHTLFNTMDFTDENGKTIRALDKGHLTFLDDPEVRKIAAKYGDPDEILKGKWIPPMPGINVPGDYMKDYGSDPYGFNHPYLERLRRELGWSQ
ncbi:MAG: hypothetical protein HYX73_10580 [Acidobacteria bacterium]|nr:hypothetical protein [Acidobacteriota bacterium]